VFKIFVSGSEIVSLSGKKTGHLEGNINEINTAVLLHV
jgi:hypothetical protein